MGPFGLSTGDKEVALSKDAHLELTKSEAAGFSARFLSVFLANGFGAMPKREIEILVFHLLTETKAHGQLTSYELSNKLRISENRVRTLRLEASLRYRQSSHREAIQRLGVMFLKDAAIRPVIEGNYLLMEVEDPVLQRELEEAARKAGYYADSSFRRQIVRIKPHVFVKIFADCFGEIEKEFVQIVKKEIEDESEVQRLLDKALPLGQRVELFLAKHERKIEMISKILRPLRSLAHGT